MEIVRKPGTEVAIVLFSDCILMRVLKKKEISKLAIVYLCSLLGVLLTPTTSIGAVSYEDQYIEEASTVDNLNIYTETLHANHISANNLAVIECEDRENQFSTIEDSGGLIRIEGSSVLGNEIRAVIQRYSNRLLSSEEKNSLRDEITLLYINNGYLTSRAEILEEDYSNNISVNSSSVDSSLTLIKIIEGSIGNIYVHGEPDTSKRRALKEYIENKVGVQENVCASPLEVNKLEMALRELQRELSPMRFTAVLTEAQSQNETATSNNFDQRSLSDLRIDISCKNDFFDWYETVLQLADTEVCWDFGISFDNDATPNLGSERLGVNFQVGNPYGLDIALDADIPVGFDEFDDNFSYSGLVNLPVEAIVPFRGSGEVLLQTERNENEIFQNPFKRSEFRLKSSSSGVTYRHPISFIFNEDPAQELAVSVGFFFEKSQTFVFDNIGVPIGFGPDSDGVTKTRVLSLGVDYKDIDSSGQWFLNSRLNIGTSLFGATNNSGNIPDGQFISFLGQAQRLQSLSKNNLLIFQAEVQLAFDSLLSSQQYSIGGQQSLRGYRKNVRSGDSGFRILLEDRITLLEKFNTQTLLSKPVLQVAPFLEMGAVWNHSSNPNSLSSESFLADIGVGLLFEPLSGVQLRADYAIPLFKVDDRGNSLQDNGFHFGIYLGL